MNKYIFTVEIEADSITEGAFDQAFDQLEGLPDDEFERKFTLIDVTNNKTFSGTELRKILGLDS